MTRLSKLNIRLTAITAALMSVFTINAQAATAIYNPSDNTVELPIVEVLDGAASNFFSAKLQLVGGNELVLVDAQPIAPAKNVQRNVYDSATTAVHIASVDAGGAEFYAKLRLIPGSNPLRFTLEQLVNNQFDACPDFATPGPIANSCVLSGEIRNRNITLTKNTQWILSGGVFIGGDKTDNATITINPGTRIVGQEGADYLWVRRGSKILAEGTPDNPIVFTGPTEQQAGEWGGVVLNGFARINGCNEGTAVCEVANEAITTEFAGGNNDADNSGIMKYVQILFAGFAVRPDEELNGLTLNAVGSGTVLEFIQVHRGLDDGIEIFGGTANLKHIVLSSVEDDSLDWGLGWRGKAQFILIKQSESDGDHGIEADNNQNNPNIAPRSKPVLSNMTIIGSPVSQASGALLRRGTGVNIWNSIFTGFQSCLTIDGTATSALVGQATELSINNSFVNGCQNSFAESGGATASTADWFNSQTGNKAQDPLLNGFFPAAGSPVLQAGATLSDNFLKPVSYAGAFRDANDNWTQEWTFPF